MKIFGHITLLPIMASFVYYTTEAQHFTDMSVQTTFNATGKNHGVAIGDFNRDGFDDIYVSRADDPNLLYVNLGDFQFEEAGAAYGVDYAGHTNCSVWFDLDQDDDLDLFLGNGFENNVLYRNDGNHFTDVSAAFGIQTSGNVRSVNAVDFDNDGDLDIYVGVVLQQNILWRNDGNHFTDITAAAGITNIGRSLGAIFFDYDLDGDQDLYQTRDGHDQNLMYRNNGDGTFTDVSVETRLDFAGFCMGAGIGDLNSDGFADVYLTNLDSNKLYISDGLGAYSEISTAAGVADVGMGWSNFFFDYDNNTQQDIYISNDSYFVIPGHGKLRNRLFINQGNLSFSSEDYVGNIQNEFGSYGAAYSDFDHDGKLDIVIVNEGPIDGNQLFKNITPVKNYIAFDLEGIVSNGQAIGSRVVLYSGQTVQSQYIVASSGYASQNTSVAHFGLGDLNSIDSVIIYWPSGLRQKSGKLPINQRHKVREGESLLANGSLVWTDPAFPTKLDQVTVFFDATQGNAALAGYQGDVYAHTGVITSESANGNDWQHVIGNWGTADGRVLMTREEENIYSITYTIEDFYNIPAPEEVYQMAFVFRNVNGTIVGRDSDGSDIFTPVFPSDLGLYITLKSPAEDEVLIYEDDSLWIDVVVSDTALLEIFDNDVLIFSDTVDHTAFFLYPSSLGNHLLRFEATADTMFILEKPYFVIERNPVKMNPPSGTVHGLNYFSDSTYVFQLYAPLKEYVFLLCPANSYLPDSEYQMQIAEDDGTYWIELPRTHFADGKSTYQYLVEGGIRIADPFAEVVLDPWNDAWIDADVMSTLPPYPHGMTEGIVTAFDEEYQSFHFEIDDFQKPEKSKLIIYELLLRDFVADHSFTTLLDTLDYFVRLGVNAIELMPVSEFEGNVSWGYNQSFHMAIDKYYGTREQLKAFIDAAHQRGIAVIMDVVFNHTFSQSPLAALYWDAQDFAPSPESPYLNVIPRHPFNVGYDFNHESLATKYWVKRILSYWIDEFKVDGFRFDLSKGLTQFYSGNDAGLMSRYDASRIAILKDYADHVWSMDSAAYVIMEHFADNNEEIVLSDYGMMLWGNINYGFSQAAKGYQSDLEWADYTVRGWDDPHLISYMESHDEERQMYRVMTEGDSEGDYNTRELTTALERMAAISTIYYSIPGPKMIWQFGEMGYDFSINRCINGTIANECRLDPKPIRWDYMDDYWRDRLWQVISAMIHLRTQYPAFSSEDFLFNDGNFYLKTIHLNHPDMDVVTMANFRVINSEINPKFQYPGKWYEYFTGDSLEVIDTQKKIPLKPGEYRLYSSKRIMPPGGFLSVTHELDVQNIGLYPNLVADGDQVYGSLPVGIEVTSIRLFDIAGRLYDVDDFESVENEFSFWLSQELPPGLYAVLIQSAQENYIGKIVKP